MSGTETVEQIRARWNTPPTNDGVARMIGEHSPEGDTRAAAAINPVSDEQLAERKRDQSLPKEITSLSLDPDTGQPFTGDPGDVEDKYTDMDQEALRKEIDQRNEGKEEDDLISKGGSNDDLRARLREDDLASEQAGGA